MSGKISVLISFIFLFSAPTFAVAGAPDQDHLAGQLATAMNADRVEVQELTFLAVRSRYLFPFKAHLYSAWNGERPVRTPDFYDVAFTVAKGRDRYAFRCLLRSYGASYVGIGVIDTSPSVVILTEECHYETSWTSLPPERAGLRLRHARGGESVLLFARPTYELRH